MTASASAQIKPEWVARHTGMDGFFFGFQIPVVGVTDREGAMYINSSINRSRFTDILTAKQALDSKLVSSVTYEGPSGSTLAKASRSTALATSSWRARRALDPSGFMDILTLKYPGPGGCYPDCDTSTGIGVLDIFDFLCFQNLFVNSEPYACDCDLSTGNGVCDIFDFLCFQSAFVGGCP